MFIRVLSLSSIHSGTLMLSTAGATRMESGDASVLSRTPLAPALEAELALELALELFVGRPLSEGEVSAGRGDAPPRELLQKTQPGLRRG